MAPPIVPIEVQECERRASFLLNEVSLCVIRERATFLALEPESNMTLGSLPELAKARMAELKALREQKKP